MFFSETIFALWILCTLSSLQGIFRYSKFEYFICPGWIVPYSGSTGLKNTTYVNDVYQQSFYCAYLREDDK